MSAHAAEYDTTPLQFADAAQALLALLQEMLAAESQDPVLNRLPGAELAARIAEPLPDQPTPFGELLELCRSRLLPYRRKNGHPRFFGYVCASADPLGALTDALRSGLDQNVTAWRSSPAAAEIERQAVAWLGELVGFGGSHGLLTSGGSMANFHGVACAVANAAGTRERVVVYMSGEAHLSLRKAARVLGLAEERIRVVPIDAERRMRADALERAIRTDRAAGLVPTCVCVSAGTANTGAIDPLDAIAELCGREQVWLHIDGAYGAPAAATAGYAWMRDPFSRADSLSLDPHKWLFAPLDVGCLLVRNEAATRHAFALDSEYTAVTESDPRESHAFFDHGLELSRRARGLKVWMLLKLRGRRALAGAIQHDIAVRSHLDARVAREPRLEALGSGLSIACFRYRPPGDHDERRLEAVNRSILSALVESGRFFLSPTTLDGRYSLRVCIVNFRTQPGDVDALLDAVLESGASLT